jgi:hypothetical protein
MFKPDIRAVHAGTSYKTWRIEAGMFKPDIRAVHAGTSYQTWRIKAGMFKHIFV